ncbi:DUF4062 domain-containing protein [Sulfurimonas aquatica]|uniref:DUF4062 domain-containing protein n=1 Tax=Sulfurimonas aquatica TaxID=2672570 RepID=A0A975B0V8_9BACT|nr:ankyrin repeat domain-containing protein [Sulfurimonas aquatica]QSZ42184.1 DUF4062 domain-containing protein [Sulfurimonas aquatica]
MNKSKTFRLFISSTFSDFQEERHILHETVFPVLNKHCLDNGYQFQPIDLRWGVNNEAQLDQKALDICLHEVKECKAFPHPNFLIMQGDRYGWIPLPYAIAKEEYESIITYIESNQDSVELNYRSYKVYADVSTPTSFHEEQKESRKISELQLLTQWYSFDANQIVDSKKESSIGAYILTKRVGEYTIYENWEAEEIALREILQKAVTTLKILNKDEKYFLSATEHEVREGICSYKEGERLVSELCQNQQIVDKKHVYAFIRTISNFDDSSKSYVDENHLNSDTFKDALRRSIDDENIIELKTTYCKNDTLDQNYLATFSKDITEHFLNAIKEQIGQAEMPEFERIKHEQNYYFQNRYKFFMARKHELDFLEKIHSHTEKNSTPFILYGKKGVGKSSILYNFYSNTQNIIIASIESSPLLANLSYLEKFVMYELDCLNENDNKTVIIDGLNYVDGFQEVFLLVDNINTKYNNIRFIISTNSFVQYKQLITIKPWADIFVDNISLEEQFDPVQYINLTLSSENRVLQREQADALVSQVDFQNLTIFNSLIFLHRTTPFDHVLQTDRFFTTLEEVHSYYDEHYLKYFSQELIANFIGYISSSNNGLSELELNTLLRKNKEVYLSIKNEFHELADEQIPSSVWTMLLNAVSPFVSKTENNGLIIYFIKDEQFKRYIFDYYRLDAVSLNGDIANLFSSSKTQRGYLVYLYALLGSKQYEKLFLFFTDNILKSIDQFEMMEVYVSIFESLNSEGLFSKYNKKYGELKSELEKINKVSFMSFSLIVAARLDAVNYIKYFSESSESLTKVHWFNADILTHAVVCASMKVIQYIGESIETFNVTNMANTYPIVHATHLNQTSVVEYLIDAGAKVNMNNPKNWSPLILAAENGNTILVKRFLEEGIDVNIINNGYTPLLKAAQNQNKSAAYETCKILLENGADVNAVEKDHDSVEEIESKKLAINDIDEFSLIKSILIEEDDSDYDLANIESMHSSSLSYAVLFENVELVKILLEYGADVNHQNKLGDTPLKYLCNNDNVKILKMLLDKGADLFEIDKNDKDTIFYYFRNNNEKIINYLFDRGDIPLSININEKDKYLDIALAYDNLAYFHRLHAEEVVLNERNIQGRNLLFVAIDHKAVRCLDFLITEVGLDVNDQDKASQTILTHITSNPGLNATQEAAAYKVISKALNLGANPNIQGQNGYTALFWALSKDLYDVCTLLVEHEANPDLPVASGTTPFVYAAAKNELKFLELLLPKVKNINMRSKGGMTALIMAAKLDHKLIMQGQSNYSKVKYLLENGADKTIYSDAGMLASDYTFEPEVEVLLLSYGTDEIFLPKIGVFNILEDMTSDEIFKLVNIPYNRKIIDEEFSTVQKEIRELILDNQITESIQASLYVIRLLPNKFIENEEMYTQMAGYLRELITYNTKIEKILEYQKLENSSIQNYVKYYLLVSEIYPNNRDLWWDSYITFFINFSYFLDSNQYKESRIFAKKAIDIVNTISNGLKSNKDLHRINQIKNHFSNLATVISNSTYHTNSIINNEFVLSEDRLMLFIRENVIETEMNEQFEYTAMESYEFRDIFQKLLAYSSDQIETASKYDYKQKKILHNFFMNFCNSIIAHINENDYAQAIAGLEHLKTKLPDSFLFENKILQKSFNQLEEHLGNKVEFDEDEIPF